LLDQIRSSVKNPPSQEIHFQPIVQ
jgi:hypothetical protein